MSEGVRNDPTDVVVAATFPFGRYAATPWFRSRREHVGNVEWPPSPWRIARALVCAAHRLEGEPLEEAVALVRRLAAVIPQFCLPPAREIVYAQWMPALAFDDSPGAKDRSENGHTLLAVDPHRELQVRWPGLNLSADETTLLARLLEAIPYLGQSVAMCHMMLAAGWRARARDEGVAVPRQAEHELADAPGERHVIPLLVPDPSVSRDQLEASTADALLKAMPAPLGARWIEYVRFVPALPRRRSREPRIAAVVHRLEGPLRPAVAGPNHPEAGRSGPKPVPQVKVLLARACEVDLHADEVIPADDDLDGRAERLVVKLGTPRPRSAIGRLLVPEKPLTGPGIECALRLESVIWESNQERPAPSPYRRQLEHLLVFRLESEWRPLLTETLVVTETFRRRLLGVAGRRLGADAIPPKLSGKRADGTAAQHDHAHVHVLVAAGDGREIDRLAVWCPAGLDGVDVELVRAVTLPMLVGSPIHLVPVDDSPFSSAARRFVSHTPFFPIRHPKRRGGVLRDAPADQVKHEVARRGLPEPIDMSPVGGPWGSFRAVRLAKQGAFPYLGAHGFALEFSGEVSGPIAIGRNSHYGMGLFLPAK